MAGFASSLNKAPAVPEILGKPEHEYYRLYSEPPGDPPEGQVLLQRVPHSRILKVTLYNGESHRIMHGQDIYLRLAAFGVDKEKAERVMDYVWNFYHVYVVTTGEVPSEPQDVPRI